MTDLENKMNSAVSHFEKELNTLRTSRANPSMLDNIYVDAYGSKTPINQLGNISIQDATTITIRSSVHIGCFFAMRCDHNIMARTMDIAAPCEANPPFHTIKISPR